MTSEELIVYIREELKGCSGYAFIDRVLKELLVEFKKREKFSPDKFKKWFHDSNIIYKQSPIAFLSKCGMEDLLNGNFDKDHDVRLSLHSLLEYMCKHGYTFSDVDVITIDVYLDYIFNHELMTIEEIRGWVDNALAYCDKNGKNGAIFKQLFRKSKSMKSLALPYEELDSKVKTDLEEWERLSKELEDGVGKPHESENYEEKSNQTNNKTT